IDLPPEGRIPCEMPYIEVTRASQWEWRMLQFVQDILYRPKSSPINLALRYALFDTESYNSRIYSFENNALYVFSVPANYYQGSRAYVLFRLKFLRRFDL
ncbi:MAG: hypothetical protein P8H43_02475, partial [Crocinitomicaceae bacterium]|nr:hypothetical protein [Crocinitomicaceae bacterium]